MSSTRLPRKVLKPILDRPMLELQVERLKRATQIDRLAVATSNRPDDKVIIDLCHKLGIDVYAGALNNVLDRFYQVATHLRADHVVRFTGDCPLIDPDLVDELVLFYRNENCDYASNCRPPTLPDGLDTEIFSFEALKAAWSEATDPIDLEHVVPFIVRQPERFRVRTYRYHEDLSNFRLTVDEPEDFTVVKAIFEALYPINSKFKLRDILEFIRNNPDMESINAAHKCRREYENIERNEI